MEECGSRREKEEQRYEPDFREQEQLQRPPDAEDEGGAGGYARQEGVLEAEGDSERDQDDAAEQRPETEEEGDEKTRSVLRAAMDQS